ncbi:MlaD family protein [Nocardioides sp. W7]|uniref:MCE family protein n=1 Tax=Nocardioides sp. W7 TaxID=2931390 RepID=UPI001FD0C561|nr:MlaD family protein [Nocardioides sp. W7]
MITRRTKVQLLVFVIVTLVGVSFVGARYARLDRLFIDDSYAVVAHFPDSGGIFAGGEVSYRGVKVGEVSELVLTDAGVDVHLSIDNDQDRIPADTLAVVGNRSAVGEQYVELQPQVDKGPYLAESSEIEEEATRIPIATEKLLTDLSDTAGSVDREALRTTVSELGDAFEGTGPDLQRIIDTGNSFLETANANFDVTAALIRDSNTVLQGQVDSAGALRTFASRLKLFTGELAASDPALRRLIETGSLAATELRTFLKQNGVELGDLINNLVTTGEVVTANLPGIEQLLVVYPYIVEGGYTVVSKSPDTGLYDAHFGLILTTHPSCRQGYESTDRRTPQDRDDRPMNAKAGCTEPAGTSNARGPQNLAPRAPADYDAPVVASYDRGSGELTWLPNGTADPARPDTVAPPSPGEESWKWLYLQPLLARP